MRFVDEAKIIIRSGSGGGGSVSFRREKYVPRGGPDGGDGGKGGDVIFRASTNLLTLYDYRHASIQAAESGKSGSGRLCYGRAGVDRIVEVPVGTQVFEESPEGERLIADFTREGQEIVVAEGGRGGKGNAHFKSSVMQVPRFAQPGEPGVEKYTRLELKVFADVGLLGLPNAGKSTFISRISAARPKIAAYPFTTLAPNLGVVLDEMERKLVVADIPGLIEGAHTGLGLGHTFLRHVERSRFLVHILSIEDVNVDDPLSGFHILDDELRQFDPALAEKPQMRVVNKIDLADETRLSEVRAAFDRLGLKVYFMSALDETGVAEVLEAMWTLHLETVKDETEDGTDD
jgi:GTP-binding protein